MYRACSEDEHRLSLEILVSTKLKRGLMFFDREKLLFISCPVFQIIFKDQDKEQH